MSTLESDHTHTVFRSTIDLIATCPLGSGVIFDYALPRHALAAHELEARDTRSARVASIGEPLQLFFTPGEIAGELSEFSVLEDWMLRTQQSLFCKPHRSAEPSRSIRKHDRRMALQECSVGCDKPNILLKEARPLIRCRLAAMFVISVTSMWLPRMLNAEKKAYGDVHFPISCRAGVQPHFDIGVALLQSFEFTEAEQAFSQVEKDDPQCVIAAWGMALSKTQRNGANAPQKDLAAGWTQLQPWLAIKAGTDREQMYVNAIRAMYEVLLSELFVVVFQNYLS